MSFTNYRIFWLFLDNVFHGMHDSHARKSFCFPHLHKYMCLKMGQLLMEDSLTINSSIPFFQVNVFFKPT